MDASSEADPSFDGIPRLCSLGIDRVRKLGAIPDHIPKNKVLAKKMALFDTS